MEDTLYDPIELLDEDLDLVAGGQESAEVDINVNEVPVDINVNEALVLQ